MDTRATITGVVGLLGYTVTTAPCPTCLKGQSVDVGEWLKKWVGQRVCITVEVAPDSPEEYWREKEERRRFPHSEKLR